jgi:hypothetical protein
MNMKRSKVLSKGFLFLNSNIFEVLVSEYYDPAFGKQKCQFILLDIVQLGQLKTPDFSSNDGCQLGDLELLIVSG